MKNLCDVHEYHAQRYPEDMEKGPDYTGTVEDYCNVDSTWEEANVTSRVCTWLCSIRNSICNDTALNFEEDNKDLLLKA